MERNIRAASVQIEHAAGDKDANLDKIRHFTGLAAEQGVDILVFPECCITGYWYLRHLACAALLQIAEPVPDGPSTPILRDLARKHKMTVGAGLVERSANDTLYNTYVVALPDGSVQRHRKLHCFISEHLQSGSEYTVFDTPHGCRVAVLICYDNNIGENVRISALKGAEILLAPHQTGGCKTSDSNVMGLIERPVWENRHSDPQTIERELRGPKGRGWLMRWLPTRAHDNGLFLIFSNGVGIDDDEVRTGNAMILDPYGRILTETWAAEDTMVTAELNRSLIQHSSGRRWMQARRPELYSLLTARTGIERTTREVRFDGQHA